MITHVVVLKWNPEITDEHVETVRLALMTLPAEISEIATYHCGPNVGPGEVNSDFAVVATFASLDDWRVYDGHPAHQQVRSELMVPWIAQRSVIQFES